jgi:hypothetical protein
MEATVQHIFQHHFAQYHQRHKMAYKHYQAANALMTCRTAAMGGHVQRCPDGHEQRIQYHSCKHRSCPLCSALPKAQWVEKQKDRLLACDHYHVIFTLPHELLDLWRYNTSWFTHVFFRVVRDTLMTLLNDERHLGALPGILMSMHTWGRTLNLHPHIHCLVTGGGLTFGGEWKSVTHDYLLPVRVVKGLYKGKLLAHLWEALKADELTLPPTLTDMDAKKLLRRVGKKSWNVRLQERYPHGKGVMLYLARYVKGGPLANPRIQSANARQVTFRYKDHRDRQLKVMQLTTDHFIERLLWHVPEKGQHLIRHYGLYGHHAKARRNLCRAQLHQPPEPDTVKPLDWQQFCDQLGKSQMTHCRTCGKALRRGEKVGRWRKNSYNRRMHQGLVQQAVRPDAAPGMDLNKGPPIHD